NLKLKNRDNSRIVSKSGEIFIKIKITNDVPSGLLVVPFHFKSCLVNKLFPLEIDPISKTANLKRIAVNIEKWD
ncbi:MAG: formate dehydrogenase subunit alpha, partial [Nanoarchaeota archaeon]|nr:formate dehydrogenase subunit alpha [Nanoarchaeota archaeon]